MSKTLSKFTYCCFFLYHLIFYSFFTFVGYKKAFINLNTARENQLLLPSYSSIETKSKEIKIFLDLKYKSNILQNDDSLSYILDKEGKILGRKIDYGRKITPNLVDLTIHLNRKFLRSTLFGSIKLIKL